MNNLSIYIVIAALFVLPSTASAQFNPLRKIGDIDQAISRQNNIASEAIKKAGEEKKRDEAKQRKEAEQRQKDLQAREEAVRKQQAMEEIRLKQLEIDQLRQKAQEYLDTIKNLQTELGQARVQLKNEQDRTASKANELKNTEQLLTIRAEQLKLQELRAEATERTKKEAEESVLNWIYGVVVSSFVAGVAVLGAIKLWLEILELRMKTTHPSTPGGGTSPHTDGPDGAI